MQQRPMTWAMAAALGAASVSYACEIPTTPLGDSITTPFRIQVQNMTRPDVHNQYMNLFQAGGGDQHLFIGPVGVPTFDLTLSQGVIRRNALRAVIGGEFSEIDYTTKMFMTERGDPAAVFVPTYACNPETDQLQIELRFTGWADHPAGGWNCVRPSFDGSHEFRYYPPGNDRVDPNRECVKVTLVALVGQSPGTTLSTSTTTSSTSKSVGSSTSTAPDTTTSPSSTPTATTTTPTASGTPVPFTDLTASGFAFLGCAPEERRATDGAGRVLTGALLADDAMTNQRCAAFCTSSGYKYAGTEWSRECWCGNSYRPTREPGSTWASLAGCNFKCSGDATQICGGDAWLSLYEACVPGQPCVNRVFT